MTPNSDTKICLTPNRLLGRSFRFSAGPSKTLLASRLSFCIDGTIIGYKHRNEASWAVEDGKVVTYTKQLVRSCIFTQMDENDGLLRLSGRFLLTQDGQTHYLDEVESAISRIQSIPEVLRFDSEFGEELNHFIPYIHWLYQAGELIGRRVETYAGMEPFYFFLQGDQIVTRNQSRRFLNPNDAPRYYLHRSGLYARRSGFEWAPDYRSHYAQYFGSEKPLLVVHNKYTSEWNGAPVNFFELSTLSALFSTLKDKFQIVFFEAARPSDAARGYSMDHQASLPYDDIEVAKMHPEVTIFGDLLRNSADSYNLLKLKIFSSCFHFITTQGGSAHMCAHFPGSLVYIQHTTGGEEFHAYTNGIFQFLSNPCPTYFIGRDSTATLEITGAFEDSTEICGRVQLGPRGIELYRKYNPNSWTHARSS